MRATSRFLVLAAFGLLVGGCGPTLRWDRYGADDAMMQADRHECRMTAERQGRQQFSDFQQAQSQRWGGLGGSRISYEREVESRCMRNKGYFLMQVSS